MQFRYILILFYILGTVNSSFGEELQTAPEPIYPELEYLFELTTSEDDFQRDNVSDIVDYVRTMTVGSGGKLNTRKGISGAFYSFSVKGDLGHILDYSYNPEIPSYVTMPSSLSVQKWLTPQTGGELQNLPRTLESIKNIHLVRGKANEVITPDTNTGGYYGYNQDRLVVFMPGETGPVLLSVSIQAGVSDVGKKGCVVGDDMDWNYLYSGKTGLNKGGLGWVSSYMYNAHSVIIYVADSEKNTVNISSFKWLDAGWAKMNLVKSTHILNGIKRFANDFKTVLESPGLPDPEVLAGKYNALRQSDEEELRNIVSVYLQSLVDADSAAVRSNPFKKLLASGKYLKKMSRDEMVKVLILEYIKESIGKKSPVKLASAEKPKNNG
ncbi:MAG: hypothetical protein ACI8ZB_001418 [Desulforhopalus sp.]|jgi:hypothetical protein